MSLSLLITVNALADIALVGALAWVMSRPSHLTPHVGSAGRRARSAAGRPRHDLRPAPITRPGLARSRAALSRRPGARTPAVQESPS